MKITENYFEKYISKENLERLVNPKTVPLFLDKIKQEYQDLIACVVNDEKISFKKLYDDVAVVCAKINSLKIPSQTNIGVICNNNYNFVKTVLGIMASGAVAVLLPVGLDEKSIYGCTLKYDLQCLFYENELEQQVELTKKSLLNVLFIKIETYNLQAIKFNYNITPKDRACIVLTGGTTGRSKGAILSHLAVMQGMLNGTYGITDVFYQRYYSIMPLTHVFGLIRNLFTSLYTGSTIYFCLDKRNMFKEIKQVQPTILVLVPALAEIFLNLCKRFGLDVLGGALKVIICGGANVPPYLITEFPKYGVSLLPGYGLTETANLVSGNAEGVNKPLSVGHFYPGQEVKIVDGELWLKGDNLFEAYYNEPEENRKAFVDGWFRTGDLVRIDDDGDLYIIGRMKEIIVLHNGENVYPAYIETKINSLEIVQDSLVTLVSNKYGNEILCCEVILRQAVINDLKISNVEQYLQDEIAKINQTLYDYEQVKKIIIRTTDFDRSPSMKIIRPKGKV